MALRIALTIHRAYLLAEAKRQGWTPAVILAYRPTKGKGQNDMRVLWQPLLQIWERSLWLSALSLPSMRKSVHGTAQWPFCRHVHLTRRSGVGSAAHDGRALG